MKINEKYLHLIDTESESVPFWVFLSRNAEINLPFAQKHEDKLKWWVVSQNRWVKEEVLAKFAPYLLWEEICLRGNLSKEFILKFSDNIYWSKLLYCQKFSCEDLDEFSEFFKNHSRDEQTRIWNILCSEQKLDVWFVDKFTSCIPFGLLLNSKFLKKETFIKFYRKFSPRNLPFLKGNDIEEDWKSLREYRKNK